MATKCAVLLLRVSTDSQFTESQAIDLKKTAKENGFNKFQVIETKETGLADYIEKIGTNQLFKFIEKNPDYNTVFVTELSRLGRTQRVLHELKDEFVKRKIQLYIKDTNMWLFDDYKKVNGTTELAFTIYALFAESEIKQKKERFIRKRKELMESGLSFGSKILFGYKLQPMSNGKNTIAINEENANVAKTIFDWYLNGIDETYRDPSITLITRECIKKGFPSYTHSKRNVNKLLKEEGYTGLKITNNKRKNPKFGLIDGEEMYIHTSNKLKYPPILSQELFEAVQEKLKKNRTRANRYVKHTTILSKLIRCKSCGTYYGGNYRYDGNIGKHSYRCSKRGSANPCDNTQSISMSLLDSAIWSLIKTDIQALASKINELNPDLELADLEGQMKNIIKREDEIKDLSQKLIEELENRPTLVNIKLSSVEESYYKRLEKLDKEISKLLREKERIKSSQNAISAKIKGKEDIVKANLDSIETSKELIRKYINHFVNSIEILYHDTAVSVIGVNFKNYTKRYMEYYRNANKGSFIDDGLDEWVTLIIDKHYTLDIKVYKETKKFGESHLEQILKRGTAFEEYFRIPFEKLKCYYKGY